MDDKRTANTEEKTEPTPEEAQAQARREAREQAAKELRRKQERKIAQFEKKWREADYSGTNAGKSLVVFGIFSFMQALSGIKEAKHLFSQEEMAYLKTLPESRAERIAYQGYAHLAEWLTINFSAALFQMELYTGSIMELDSIVCKVIREECLKQLLPQEERGNLFPLLQQMGLNYMGVQSETEFPEQFALVDDRIQYAKRYIKVFDTGIDLLAKETEIKELDVFKIRSSFIGNERASAIALAEKTYKSDLDRLMSLIEGKEEYQTPYYQNIIAQYLQPVEVEAEPIPPANIKAAQNLITGLNVFSSGVHTGVFLDRIGRNYWR